LAYGSSIFVNIRQYYSSIIIHQYSSIFINIHQYSSIFFNIHQYSSIFINIHQSSLPKASGFDMVLTEPMNK